MFDGLASSVVAAGKRPPRDRLLPLSALPTIRRLLMAPVIIQLRLDNPAGDDRVSRTDPTIPQPARSSANDGVRPSLPVTGPMSKTRGRRWAALSIGFRSAGCERDTFPSRRCRRCSRARPKNFRAGHPRLAVLARGACPATRSQFNGDGSGVRWTLNLEEAAT
jgi:hypothetical protein